MKKVQTKIWVLHKILQKTKRLQPIKIQLNKIGLNKPQNNRVLIKRTNKTSK